MKRKVITKWIALLLIVTSLFLITNKEIAYAFPFKNKQEFLNYVEIMGLPTSYNGYEINYDIYKDKQLIVYGKPTDIENNEFKNREWRYLGYSIFGGPFTNQDFPNDPGASGTPDTWSFISSSNAQKTWNDLKSLYPSLYDYNLNTKLKGHGNNGLTCADIGTDKVRLLSPATIYANGAAYVEFINQHGMKRYATFTIPAMTYSSILDGEIITNTDHYIMPKDQNEVRVQVTVKAKVDLIGAIQASHIKKIRAEGIDKNENILSFNEASNITNVSTTYTLILSRQQYGPGTHQIELNGRVLFSTVFNDIDAKKISKTIYLTIEADDTNKGQPVAIINAPDASTVGKRVTISGENSYSPNGEITDYDWYIKQIEAAEGEEIDPDIPNTLTIDGPKGSVSFPNVGEYEIRLTVTDVAGKQDTTTHTIRIEKGNIPPEAILKVPDTVRVGDNVFLDGSDSYDPDGYIDMYEWYVYPPEGMNGDLYNLSCNTVWFETEGKKTVDLLVWDDLGAMRGTSANINVLPPKPIAKLNYSGTLKENRKIVLDATESNGPDHYPITSWDWEVTAENGGDVNLIKYHGELDGSNKKEIIIKKAGTYTFSLTVSNDLGYSDTTSITLNIVEDKEPIISLNTLEYILRDPSDNNYATIDAKDESMSVDGDYIAHSNFTLIYDSDNDGSFDDETPIDRQDIENYIYKTKEVGKYYLNLEVIEGFGEETILDFITPEDYKKASQGVIIEVKNVAPVVDFKMIDPIEVNLIFAVGNTTYSDNEIKNKINSIIIPKLEANGLKLNYSIKHYNPHLPMACDQFYLFGFDDRSAPPQYARIYKYNINEDKYSRVDVHDGFSSANRSDVMLCTYDGKVVYLTYQTVYEGNGKTFSYDVLRCYDAVTDKEFVIRDLEKEYENDEDCRIEFIRLNKYNQVIYGANGETYIYDLNTKKGHKVSENEEYDNGYSYSEMVESTPNGLSYEYDYDYDKSRDKYELSLTISDRFDRIKRKTFYSKSTSYKYSNFIPGRYLPHQFGSDLDILLSNSISSIFNYNQSNYLVSIDDTAIEEFESEKLSKNISSMLNIYNAGYFGISNTKNKGNVEQFLSKINNGGAFANISNLDSAFAALADMIVDKEKSSEDIIRYFLINEEVEYETFYYDMENDPMYSQKWIVNHTDPDFFENSLGVYELSGKEQYSPVKVFTKTGEYEIISQVRDNPKNNNLFDEYRLWSNASDSTLKIYVHRRPIADFTAYMKEISYREKYELQVSDRSFDWDHTSLPNKGIVEKEWKWKYSDSNVWNDGLPTQTFSYTSKTIDVFLRVKDIEGAWSEPTIIRVGTGYNNSPPVARFRINNGPSMSVDDVLSITDLSWDPDGDNIGTRSWQVYKDGIMIYSDSTLSIDFKNYGPGTYRIRLRVKDDGPGTPSYGRLWSDWYAQDLVVLNNNAGPSVTLSYTPNVVFQGDTVNINILPDDPDKDLLNISLKMKKNSGSWNEVLNLHDVEPGKIQKYVIKNIDIGTYYFSCTVTDPYGETATANIEFTVIPLVVEGNVLHTDLWNSHRIQYNRKYSGTDDSPRTYDIFFPGEKFLLQATTNENLKADKVQVTILEEGFSALLRNEKDNLWTGEIWDKSMFYWKDRTLNFEFVAYYPNGFITTDVVTVYIKDDKYFRLHGKF